MFGMNGGNAPSGLEMMLQSMGLGEVITAAKKLASDGTLQKVLKFADEVEAINGRIEQIAANQRAIMRHFGIEPVAQPGSGNGPQLLAGPETGGPGGDTDNANAA